VFILITLVFVIGESFSTLLVSRDDSWESHWIWEAIWFALFTLFAFAVVVILQPNSSSDLLTQMDEILDETLHEMPTQEHIDDMTPPDLELH